MKYLVFFYDFVTDDQIEQEMLTNVQPVEGMMIDNLGLLGPYVVDTVRWFIPREDSAAAQPGQPEVLHVWLRRKNLPPLPS